MLRVFFFPSLLPMLCVPWTIHVVRSLPFCVGSRKKIHLGPWRVYHQMLYGSTKRAVCSVKAWEAAGIIRGCLWAGRKACWLCEQLASCAARPHQAQVRILQLVPFLSAQGEAVPAAACWIPQGCNPAGGILGAASSGAGLLAAFTFLPSLETSIL